MNLRFIDWIWHVRGSVPLAPGQSEDEAFERLDPLFRQGGTTHDRAEATLTFTKKDQAAQDKMSVFDGGVLAIENRGEARVLRYHLTSRALLFCFLAPLLFLAFAQLTVVINKYQKPDSPASESAKEKAKKDEVRPLNPIDKALGAPAPEKPDKDKKKDKDKDKSSPTPAYVFAALFAALYVIGRVLEDRLVRNLFRKRLHEAV
ncbi:hypothetical protein KY084_07260 [Stakelama sp. CBK3Z-3]|uniref:Uncharacterized protein n=1 Tax=Stakelama flava TaxID=2860338 RepID=A0ABS6XMK0_9SPHN|nr:hypothetical protein [Stakelama flava]MBW4330675.1 hypothetical protein [Stakelama flava]